MLLSYCVFFLSLDNTQLEALETMSAWQRGQCLERRGFETSGRGVHRPVSEPHRPHVQKKGFRWLFKVAF